MKYILLNTLLFFSLMLAAQDTEQDTEQDTKAGHYLLLKGNFGLSTLNYDLEGGNASNGIGGGGELGYRYFFNSNWGLGTGIGLSSASSKGAFDNYSMSIVGQVDDENENYTANYYFYNWEEKQKTVFAEIPLLASYQYQLENYAKWSIYADAGIKIQLPVSSSYEVIAGDFEKQGYYPDRNATLFDIPGYYERVSDYRPSGDVSYKTSVALAADCGFLYNINKVWDVFGGVAIDMGLNKVHNSSKSIVTVDATEEYNGMTGSSVSRSLNTMAIKAEVGIRIRLFKNQKDKSKAVVVPVEEVVIPEVKTLILTGKISDAKSGNPLISKIEISDNETVIYSQESAEDGTFKITLPDGKKQYSIRIAKDEYITLNEHLDTAVSKDNKVDKDFALTPKQKYVEISGTVTDAKSNEPVFAKVRIRDIATKEVVKSTYADSLSGEYKMTILEPEQLSELEIDAYAVNYLLEMQSITVNKGDELITKNMKLVSSEKGAKLIFKNILCEIGTAKFDNSAYPELDKLVKIMKASDHINIELSGHTDSTGTNAINDKLSQARANAVKDYLVSNGIAASRMKTKGYGSNMPIDSNSTVEGRANNRRIEMKIID